MAEAGSGHAGNLDHDAIALAPHVGRGALAAEDHDHAAFAGHAAAEVDLRQLDAAPAADLGRVVAGHDRGRGRTLAGPDREDQAIAVDPGRIGAGPEQLDHHARAPGGLDRRDRAGRADPDRDAALDDGAAGVVEVDRDARRRIGGEELGIGRRRGQLHDHVDLPAGDGLEGHGLQHVLGLCRREPAQRQHRDPAAESRQCGSLGGLVAARRDDGMVRGHACYPRWVISHRARWMPGARSIRPRHSESVRPVRSGLRRSR